MDCKDDYFINSDGKKLFKRSWYPSASNNNLRALVFIIHGLNEHTSFFYEETIVKPLVECNCVVATHDHLGHGRSEGERRVLAPIEILSRDVTTHINHILSEIATKSPNQSQIPLFLYGHSLGGLLAVKIVTSVTNEEGSTLPSFSVSGLILEAPALDVNKGFSYGVEMMGRCLRLMWPYYILRKPKFENLSTDPIIIDAAANDKLRNVGGLAIGTAISVADSIAEIQPKLEKLTVPFITAHGKLDLVVPMTASQLLYDETKLVKPTDKTIMLYENAKHVLRASDDEIGRDFRSKVLDWIKVRTN